MAALSLRSSLPLVDVVGTERFLQRLFDEDKDRYFHRPVKAAEAPGYYERTAHPMDLGTVRQRFKAGEYASYGELLRDVERIWSNCREYNGEGHPISLIAEAMREKARAALLQSIEAWERRHTFAGTAGHKCRALLHSVTRHKYGADFNISLRDSEIWDDYSAKSPSHTTAHHTTGTHPTLHSPPPTVQPSLRRRLLLCCVGGGRVAEPMDLTVISAKVARGEYSGVDDFAYDLRLVFTNCLAYWGGAPNSPYPLYAHYLLDEVDLSLREIRFSLATGVQAEVGGAKKGAKGGHHSKGGGAHAALKPWTPVLRQLAALSGKEGGLQTPTTPLTPPVSSITAPPPDSSAERPVMSAREHSKCLSIIAALRASPVFQAFVEPPDIPSMGIPQLVDYYERIPRRMDLTTLSRLLHICGFPTSDDFRRDASLIWRNVYAYYDGTGGCAHIANWEEDVVRPARQLEADFQRRWEAFDAPPSHTQPSNTKKPPQAPPHSDVAASPLPSAPAAGPALHPSSSSSSSTRIVLKKVKLPSSVLLLQAQAPTPDGALKAEGGSSGLKAETAEEEAKGGRAPTAVPRSVSPLPPSNASTEAAELRRPVKKEGVAPPAFTSLPPPSDAAPSAASTSPSASSLASKARQSNGAGPSAAQSSAAFAFPSAGRPSLGSSPSRASAPPSSASASAAFRPTASAVAQLLAAPPRFHKGKMVLKPLTPSQRAELVRDATARLPTVAFRAAPVTVAGQRRLPAAPPTPARKRRREADGATLPPLFQRALLDNAHTDSSAPTAAAHTSVLTDPPHLTAADFPATRAERRREVELQLGPPSPLLCPLLLPSPGCGSLLASVGFVVDGRQRWVRASHRLLAATAFFPFHVDAFTVDVAWTAEGPQPPEPLVLRCASRPGGRAAALMADTARAFEEAALRLCRWKRRRMEGEGGSEADKGGEAEGERAAAAAAAVRATAAAEAFEEAAPDVSASRDWPRLHLRAIRSSDVAQLQRLPSRLLRLRSAAGGAEDGEAAEEAGAEVMGEDVDRRVLGEPRVEGWKDRGAVAAVLRHYDGLLGAGERGWDEAGLWWSRGLQWEEAPWQAKEPTPQTRDSAAPSPASSPVRPESTRSRSRALLRGRPPSSAAGPPRRAQRRLPFVRLRLFGFAGAWALRLQPSNEALRSQPLPPPLPSHPNALLPSSLVEQWESQQRRRAEEEQRSRGRGAADVDAALAQR